MFDLKGFRENVMRRTQSEFAAMIGVRQDYLSRMEQSTEQIPLELMVKIANATGTTIDELINFKRQAPQPLVIENTWRRADFTKRTIVDYLELRGASLRESWGDSYDAQIAELRQKVERVIVKPRIAIVGHSDAGKSRLINSLLGAEKMPASWTPTTAIRVLIKHIQDRPSYIEEEAWIFRAAPTGLGITQWNDKQLYDEKYCRGWKLAGGSADILKDYGTRQGDHYSKNDAAAAVIFVDSDFLLNCDIVDLPGFGTGDRVEDDRIALEGKENADVLIYLSIANGFMRETDIDYLKESLNSLRPIENQKLNDIKSLANLYVIASQAKSVDDGNRDSLQFILDKGCERFMQSVPDSVWDKREENTGHPYDQSAVRGRFFTYATDMPLLREDFEKDLSALIEKLPQAINENAKAYIRSAIADCDSEADNKIAEYEGIVREHENYVRLLEEIQANEPQRVNESHNRRHMLIASIQKLKTSSIEDFSLSYGSLISSDSIVAIIKKKGFKKKKEDIQTLVSFLNSSLQSSMQDILEDRSEQLKNEIDDFIHHFQNDVDDSKFKSDFGNMSFNFDATKAFASGLAGLAAFGGLAVWAASLGNLGAYILVAQGVSILSAMGISVGGTAAAVAGVSAIGGPIVLGITLSILAAISVFLLISGAWEKSIAKKIVKEYDAKNALMKYKEVIEKFWKETEVAFNKAADGLETDWKRKVSELKSIVDSKDIVHIERYIAREKEYKLFLAGIPL